MTTEGIEAGDGDPPPTLEVTDGLVELPPDAREELLAQSLAELLSEEHVKRQPMDDKVSKETFPKYLEDLDGAKLYLLADQVEKLRAYETTIDDQLKRGNLVLARKGSGLLKERKQVVAKVVADLLAAPFDLEVDEELETDPKKYEYARDEAALRDRWRKLLKLQVLERIEQLESLEEAMKKPAPPSAADPPNPRRQRGAGAEGARDALSDALHAQRRRARARACGAALERRGLGVRPPHAVHAPVRKGELRHPHDRVARGDRRDARGGGPLHRRA
jgi:hypothetical protein